MHLMQIAYQNSIPEASDYEIACGSDSQIQTTNGCHLHAELACEAVGLAVKCDLSSKDAVFHADPGAQYTSTTFRCVRLPRLLQP
jgi:hypothetical protein